MSKIGIIGSGNIGGTLGTHFAKVGHQIMFSSRHPEQLKNLAQLAGSNSTRGTIEEAAQFGEIILLSIPFGKTPEVRDKIGTLSEKVLIDTNNYYPGRDGSLPGEEMKEKKLLETEWTASHFSGTHVVKAFNTIYFSTLRKRAFDQNEKMAIPFAASDELAKDTIEGLLQNIGFIGVYIGDLLKTKIMQPDEKLYTLELNENQLKKLLA